MIQKVSTLNGTAYNKSPDFSADLSFNGNKSNNNTVSPIINKSRPYADSFVKRSVQSAPLMLALTGLWSFIDCKTAKMPLKSSLANNFKSFFLPVMLISSLILSVIDNKNNNQKSK